VILFKGRRSHYFQELNQEFLIHFKSLGCGQRDYFGFENIYPKEMAAFLK